VARNRKRAKDRRRTRQPVPSDRAQHDDQLDPIRHATPDVEIAEAQMALGRPDLVDPDAEPSTPIEDEPEEELTEAEFESEEDFADAVEAGGFEVEAGYDESAPADAGRGRGRRGRRAGDADGPDSAGGAVAERPSAAHPAERRSTGSRLINFLQGSWRELQRVQWPDRRQVIQATGVVIGFVIVAGVYLGVADTVASHLMNWILK
jgi:preprotein translocase subunit SecE